MFDTLIRAATVVDGTGRRAATADIAIVDGTIVEVGSLSGRARRVIDADGLLATPGFVDVHTHFDGQATWDPHLTPSCWHGVTTAVLGNCGVGFAPAEPDRHQWLIGLMEGVEDIPGTALAEGIRWDWESFPEYLDALERMPRALDIGTHVPHAAVRAYVMKERGAANEDATEADLEAMARIVGEGLAAGALGVSTNRTAGHRTVDGDPVPGTFAAEAELFALGGALAAHGAGTFELVPAGTAAEASQDPEGSSERELDWMVRFSSATGRPVTFLVMQSTVDPDRWRRHFATVHAAQRRGVGIWPQVASRCFGVLMGLGLRLNPFRGRPSYAALAHLPLDERVRRLRQPDTRRRILAETDAEGVPPSLDTLTPAHFDHLFALGDPPDYEPPPEASIGARARRLGADPWAVLYDALLEADGGAFVLYPMLNYGNFSYDGLYEMLADPATVQGLGDGGAHCSMVCDASMTTYLLTHWVRDRWRGPRLGLEAAVRRLTADPARLYGLGDRGVLAPGYRADLNLIDFERLALALPEQVHDLPTGAGRIVQRAGGYRATMVRGEVVVDDGVCTDARPGALVRGARPGPGAP